MHMRTTQVMAFAVGGVVATLGGCAGDDDRAPTTDEQVSELRRQNPNPGVAPPGSRPFGHSYAEWSARFWKWGMEYPMDEGHPFTDDPAFDFSHRQSGEVWFWGSPGTITREVSIPEGKAIFLSMRDAECSTLEDAPFHGDTEEEQRACANWLADHLVLDDTFFCTIDGRRVKDITAYRVSSKQIHFTAPTPWM